MLLHTLTRKMVPITGRAGSFLEFSKLQSQSKLNPNLIQSIFALLFSSVSKANLSCVVATIFSSLAFISSSISMVNSSRLVVTIFSSLAFLYSSICMAKLSRLVAASFSSLALLSSSLHGQPEVFVSDHLLQFIFLSNSFSSSRFNLLRVTRSCFSWSSVSRGLLFLMTFSYSLSLIVLFPLAFVSWK